MTPRYTEVENGGTSLTVFPSEWLLSVPLIMVVRQITLKLCDIKQPPKVWFRNARKVSPPPDPAG